MIIKQGASIQGLDIRMRVSLIIADKVIAETGKEMVITSGLDGTHSAGSLHPYGLAIDIRTKYLSESEKWKVFHELKERLPGGFDVVWHESHIHIEYDEGKYCATYTRNV